MKVLFKCWSCGKEYDSETIPYQHDYKCDCGGYVISPSGKIQGKWVDESPLAKQDRLEVAHMKIAKARFSPERLLKEHQWRPIETAPRDGTTILVYDDGDVYQARWNEKHKYWEYADHEQFGCGCCSAEIDGATHWMPIPAPPRG